MRLTHRALCLETYSLLPANNYFPLKNCSWLFTKGLSWHSAWTSADLQNCKVEDGRSILLGSRKCIIRTKFQHSWERTIQLQKAKSQFHDTYSHCTHTLPSVCSSGRNFPVPQLKSQGACCCWVLKRSLFWNHHYILTQGVVQKGGE